VKCRSSHSVSRTSCTLRLVVAGVGQEQGFRHLLGDGGAALHDAPAVALTQIARSSPTGSRPKWW